MVLGLQASQLSGEGMVVGEVAPPLLWHAMTWEKRDASFAYSLPHTADRRAGSEVLRSAEMVLLLTTAALMRDQSILCLGITVKLTLVEGAQL